MLSIRYRNECMYMYFGFYSQTVLSLILLKWFNLFCPARIWDFIQFSPLLQHNPNKCSTYLISFAFDLVRCNFFFSLHHSLYAHSTFRLFGQKQRTNHHRHTHNKKTFLFDFICNSRICIVLFAELFFVDGYFLCVCFFFNHFGLCVGFCFRFTHIVHVEQCISLEYKTIFWDFLETSSNSNQTDCELLAFLYCSFFFICFC